MLSKPAKPATKSVTNKEVSEMQDIDEWFEKFVKGVDWEGSMSESQLTKVAFTHAQKFRRQGETHEQAFARFYEDPKNAYVHRAIEKTKSGFSAECFAYRPTPKQREAHIEEMSKAHPDALGEIKRLAKKLQESNPDKYTPETAFAPIYVAERQQNRPAEQQ